MVQKVAYLTIDDAPSADFQRKIDYLHSKGIPAVFFCEGEFLEQRSDMVVEAIRKGFVIGSHAYTHQYFSDHPLDVCLDQISKTHVLIEDLHRRAGILWEKRYFRFPYGDKGGLRKDDVFTDYEGDGADRKRAIQDHLRQLGYSQPAFEGITYRYFRDAGLLEDVDWHWTYDVREWGLAFHDEAFGVDSLEKVLARMDEDEPEGCRGLNYSGSEEIVLMHDHVETTHVFAIIVERLLEKGLQFRMPE